MSVKNHNIKKDDEIVLHNKDLGYVRARAMEDVPRIGELAFFKVGVNSKTLPGVVEMTINVNFWDVYSVEDKEMLSKVLDQCVPYFATR